MDEPGSGTNRNLRAVSLSVTTSLGLSEIVGSNSYRG